MWNASLHGSTDHLDPEVATEAETTLRDKLAEVFGSLVEAGHQGIAGVFHYSKGAPSDLRGGGAPAADSGEAAPANGNPVSAVPPEIHETGVAAGTAP